MKKTILFLVIAAAVLAGAYFYKTGFDGERSPGTDNPKNSAYMIENISVKLTDGVSETEDAAGSASKIITKYFGNESKGDLNGDGLSDTAFLLTQDRGGSGTFYYAVAALKTPDGYHGTNAILLGDRVAPQATEIKGGVLIANYAERSAGEPMTARPSVGVSMYSVIDNGQLRKISPLSKGEQVLWGNAAMGHEVRTFTPCGAKAEEFWVLGNSSAYGGMLKEYQTWVATQENPYAPLFMVLAGRITPAPTDGFGADYKHGFEATQIVKILPGGKCE
ncbi:MAG: hypothetical protein AAB355_00595 [Patescibacteria group bacterium]